MTTQIPDSWLRAPTPKYRYADGGDVDWSKLNQPFGELKGNSPQDTPVQFRTASPYVNITEGDIDRGMNIGMAAGPGTMVGPYGALALRNAARETGNVAAESALTHPVVGKAVSEEAAQTGLPSDLLRHRGISEQAERDDLARTLLESRAAKGDPTDADIWRHAGWERSSEGQPVKEITDTGAKLVPLKGTNKFLLEHPAGDFHKAYDIPPISFDPNLPSNLGGYTTMRQYADGRQVPESIVLGGNPTAANLKKRTTTALHEVQHFIDSREGRESGFNPRDFNINDP